jgi:hypothetical protein
MARQRTADRRAAIGFSLYSRFVAPWIEEAIKAALMILLFRMNRIG